MKIWTGKHTSSWLNLNFRKHCLLFTKLPPNSLTMRECWRYIVIYSYHISHTAAKYGAILMQLMSIVCIYVIQQKKIVRIIHHEGRLAHMNCLFKQMHSLKLHELFNYRTAIVMFKLYYGLQLPTLLQSRFKRSQHIHNIRSRNTLIVRYSRTNLKVMCISVWGVNVWNALPVNI